MPQVKGDKPHTPVRVNTVEADNWLFQRRLNKEVPKQDSTTLEVECKRLIKAQADREALENDKRRGELIHFSTAVEIMTSVVFIIRGDLRT